MNDHVEDNVRSYTLQLLNSTFTKLIVDIKAELERIVQYTDDGVFFNLENVGSGDWIITGIRKSDLDNNLYLKACTQGDDREEEIDYSEISDDPQAGLAILEYFNSYSGKVLMTSYIEEYDEDEDDRDDNEE